MSAPHIASTKRRGLMAKSTPWAALSYATNWSDFGVGLPTGAWKRDGTGRIWLKGLVKKAVALAYPDTIGTLPAGARPSSLRIFTVPSAVGAAEVRIDTAGVIVVQSGGNNGYIGLDAVSFELGT